MVDAKRVGLKCLQYALVIGTLAWLIVQTDWARTVAVLARVDLLTLAAVCVVTGLEFVSRFTMWNTLLNGRRQTHLLTAARIELVIKYINHLLPSRVAGQSIAPFAIDHYTAHDWSEAVSITGLNMGLHTLLYGSVAVVGLAVFATQLSWGLLIILGGSAGLYIVTGASVLAAGRRLPAVSVVATTASRGLGGLPIVGERLARLLDRFPSFTANAAAVFQELSSRPRLLSIYVLCWAGTLLIFPGIRVWLLLRTLGASFTPAVLLPVVLVTAYAVTVLPLTPGGVGVAEASATAVFVALGLPEAVAVPVVVLDRFFGVYLAALLGCFPMLELDLAGLDLPRDSRTEPPSSEE